MLLGSIRTLCAFAVRSTSGCASVVPRKFTAGSASELPMLLQQRPIGPASIALVRLGWKGRVASIGAVIAQGQSQPHVLGAMRRQIDVEPEAAIDDVDAFETDRRGNRAAQGRVRMGQDLEVVRR